jgi:hypothetical protein
VRRSCQSENLVGTWSSPEGAGKKRRNCALNEIELHLLTELSVAHVDDGLEDIDAGDMWK